MSLCDDVRVALWNNRIHKVTTMLFGEKSTIHVMLLSLKVKGYAVRLGYE